MQSFEVAQADGAVEVCKCGGEGAWVAEVVACGEDVACVEADADARLVVYERDDFGEVGEGGTQHCAAAGHGF